MTQQRVAPGTVSASRVIGPDRGWRTDRLGGPTTGPAEVAWVIARAAQGRGYAKEAARSLVAVLQGAGWTAARAW